MKKDKNFDELLEIATDDHGLKQPVELLIGLANGIDLTQRNKSYEIALKLKEEYGYELPDEYDYEELLISILESGKFVTVDVKDQLAAQKTLIEYQHSKKKSVDTEENNSDGLITGLNEKEIELFWKKFDEKY